MKHLKRIMWLIVIAIVPLNGFTSYEKDYKFHTVFVYNFTKYIEWPVKTDNMVIGILHGTEDVLASFKRMAELKSTPTQKFTIKNIKSAGEADGCHILFIPDKQSEKFPEVIERLSGKPVLVITEQPGLIKKGSLINFITINGKLNIELNRSACEKAGLKVSGQLLGLAILV
jgi:hypothetical protein